MSKTKFTFWYITPESKEIETVQASQSINISKTWKKLLDCDIIEFFFFEKNENTEYCLLMDEEGFDKKENKCATEILGRINLNWAKPLRGNFIVYSYSVDKEGNEIYKNMDITPKQFVELCNNRIRIENM